MSDDLSEFTAEIADQVESFVVSVREIAAGEDPNHAISLLLLQLSQLTLAGGRLGAIQDVVPDERFEPDSGYDPDLEGVRTSLAAMLRAIDDYTEVFDPIAPEPELVHSRISDDIAGILSALVHGLQHYRAGRSVEALWWWQFSYLSDWGSTAGAVLRALQSVVSHVRLDAQLDAEIETEDALLAQTAAAATGAVQERSVQESPLA